MTYAPSNSSHRISPFEPLPEGCESRVIRGGKRNSPLTRAGTRTTPAGSAASSSSSCPARAEGIAICLGGHGGHNGSAAFDLLIKGSTDLARDRPASQPASARIAREESAVTAD